MLLLLLPLANPFSICLLFAVSLSKCHSKLSLSSYSSAPKIRSFHQNFHLLKFSISFVSFKTAVDRFTNGTKFQQFILKTNDDRGKRTHGFLSHSSFEDGFECCCVYSIGAVWGRWHGVSNLIGSRKSQNSRIAWQWIERCQFIGCRRSKGKCHSILKSNFHRFSDWRSQRNWIESNWIDSVQKFIDCCCKINRTNIITQITHIPISFRY